MLVDFAEYGDARIAVGMRWNKPDQGDKRDGSRRAVAETYAFPQ